MRWFSTFSKRHKIDKHCTAGLNFPSAAVIRLLVSLNERKMGVLKLRDIYQFACLTNLLSAQFSDHSLSYFPTTLFKFDVNNSLWCSPTTLFKLEFNLFSRRQKFAQLGKSIYNFSWYLAARWVWRSGEFVSIFFNCGLFSYNVNDLEQFHL